MAHLDSSAPDIDVLVISNEATLGYFVYLVECKSALPALWAKDHLRLLHPSTMPKAFKQVARISEVLSTEAGARFLFELLTRTLPHQLDEIVVAIKSLIVTAQNSGMLFEEASKSTIVSDLPTLRQLLQRSDGDVVYLNQMLGDLKYRFGRPEDLSAVECVIDGLQVEYPAVHRARIVDVTRNEWKSTGLDKRAAADFFASGRRPFDVFNEWPGDGEHGSAH